MVLLSCSPYLFWCRIQFLQPFCSLQRCREMGRRLLNPRERRGFQPNCSGISQIGETAKQEKKNFSSFPYTSHTDRPRNLQILRLSLKFLVACCENSRVKQIFNFRKVYCTNLNWLGRKYQIFESSMSSMLYNFLSFYSTNWWMLRLNVFIQRITHTLYFSIISLKRLWMRTCWYPLGVWHKSSLLRFREISILSTIFSPFAFSICSTQWTRNARRLFRSSNRDKSAGKQDKKAFSER